MLYTVHESAPLGDLWLPLADGSDAAGDTDVTPEMLDVGRLVGERLEPGPLEAYGDHFATTTAYARVPWVEAILGSPIRATIDALGRSIFNPPLVARIASRIASASSRRRLARHRSAFSGSLA